MEFTPEERAFMIQALRAVPLHGNLETLPPALEIAFNLIKKLQEGDNGVSRETDGG